MLSANRKTFHEEMLPHFRDRLAPYPLILDIGVSQAHGQTYRKFFENYQYYTCDINPSVKPDICMNMEEPKSDFFNGFNGVIAMGTWEQTPNPYKFVDGIYKVLKPGGLLLAGIVSTAFPIYSADLVRFTPTGSHHLLSRFIILETRIVGTKEFPEYIFHIVKKPDNQ